MIRKHPDRYVIREDVAYTYSFLLWGLTTEGSHKPGRASAVNDHLDIFVRLVEVSNHSGGVSRGY